MIQYITLFHLFWPLNPLDFFFWFGIFVFAGNENSLPTDPGYPPDNYGPASSGSVLWGVHPLPHTDLAVRPLLDDWGTSGHLPGRSTDAPCGVHDHLPPWSTSTTGAPNGGLPNQPAPTGHTRESDLSRPIPVTSYHSSVVLLQL